MKFNLNDRGFSVNSAKLFTLTTLNVMMESDLADLCNAPKIRGAIAPLHVHAQRLNLPLI